MQILFLNHLGGGFADHIDVEPGLTIGELFEQRMPGRKPADYLVRCNRQPVAADHPLEEGDRVSITPTKIEGAVAA